MKTHFLPAVLLAVLFIFSANPIQAQSLDHVLGEVLVQVEEGTNMRQLTRNLNTLNGVATQANVDRNISPPFNIYLLSFDFTQINENEFLNAVSREASVKVAQFNHLLTERQTIPDDPSFNQQWQWLNPGGGGATADSDIDADLAWDITTGGTTANGDEIVVCVVEAANRNHPDLQGNLWFNEAEIPGNGIDDDGNGYVDDYNGWNPGSNNDNIPSANHGTAVSGMIGAVGNNALGVTGINWNVKIMHVTVGGLSEANVIASYTYPYTMRQLYNNTNGAEGAFVVATNASWGIDGGDPDDAPLWCGFYDDLGAEGILNCGATANVNWNIDIEGDLPTACPSDFMVSVTATDDSDVRTFSAFGVVGVDIGAPGDNIYSLTTNNYGFTSGTSFASPLTAGVIALLYSAPCSNLAALALSDPQGAALMVRDYLYAGGDIVPNLVGEIATGARVNAFNSLQLILANCGPCPAPGALEVTDLTDIAATLSWNVSDSTLSSNLRWREVGAADWNDAISATSPFALTGLLACTEYEFQIEDICASDSSGYSAGLVFQTDGCCEAPGELLVSADETNVVLSWTEVLAAESYNILLTLDGNTTELTGVTDNPFTATGLEPCAVYTVQIASVCFGGTVTDYSPAISFATLGCGPCEDNSYCVVSGDTQFEYIASVSLNTLNNVSGDDGGYGDFTGAGTMLNVGNAYEIVLEPGFQGQGYGENFRVWIDLNQDGDFDDAGELVFDAPAPTDTDISGSVGIPLGTPVGITRMRVGMSYGGGNGNQEPESCGTGIEGEYEDYCVEIVDNGMPCLAPTTIVLSNIEMTTATVSWDAAPGATAYNLLYRVIGAPSFTEISDLIVTTYDLTNLSNCEEYEVRLESVCDGAMSAVSPSESFQTMCNPPCDLPASLGSENITETGATLVWDAMPNAVEYNFRIRLASGGAWSNFVVSDNEYDLLGLSDCTEYEVQVETVCQGIDNASGYSLSHLFETACIESVGDLAGIQAFTLMPNPVTDHLDIQFDLERAGTVIFSLYSSNGQLLRSNQTDLTSGTQHFSWNGLDQYGSGLYLLKVQTATGLLVRKVVFE